MINSVKTDDIMLAVLKDSELDELITGNIYPGGQRPLNSTKEDVVLSCIALNQERPATATTNVNIHVKDLTVRIGGQTQRIVNRDRLRRLMDSAVDTIMSAQPDGIQFSIENEYVIEEPERGEHYANIRVKWYISNKEQNN